jgi:hypothetical protein
VTLALRPATLREANAYVAAHHRHHGPARGCVFCVACEADGRVCGVAVVGRPVARLLQDGRTLELTRVCTDGTPHAASKLIAAATRAALAIGCTRVVSYVLASEPGTSYRAAGWVPAEAAGGGHVASRQPPAARAAGRPAGARAEGTRREEGPMGTRRLTPRHVVLTGADGRPTHAVLVRVGRGRRWADVDVCGLVVRLALAREWHAPRGSHGEFEGGGYTLDLPLGSRDGATGTDGRAPASVDRAAVALGERIAKHVRGWSALLGQTPHVVLERTLHPYHDARYYARVRGLESGMEFYAATGRTPRSAVQALARRAGLPAAGPLPGAALDEGGGR